ncbi:hypothetical protein MKW98_032598 [Papaver atlanticum]|uniref:Choline transporter-like protein n=1 Tax=Papaver atlanticum TaxID=357466 RepID=A0AAD4SWI0_9MAGN|nr:hypothetical protein MKW98_032598 [Papaver atlanticum]
MFSVQAEDNLDTRSRRTAGTASYIFLFLFYLHLLAAVILIAYLTICGLDYSFSRENTHNFRPLDWYLPLLASSGCAFVIAFSWVTATLCNPWKTIHTVFWLSPLLTSAVGILLLLIGSAGGLATSVIAIIFALTQSLYACWAAKEINHTTKILSLSMAASVPSARNLDSFVILTGSLMAATIYTWLSVSGIGGATATWTQFDPLYIFAILLSLGWTMQVIKNAVHVGISFVSYMYFARGVEVDSLRAFRDTWRYLIGNICIGSILEPVFAVIRGSACAMTAITGDTDEFMFSCTSCYSGVARRLVSCGNRWGFVHVGVFGKGFVQSSIDTWEMFRRVGMESVVGSDLTGSFCFLCGVAGGSMCTLVAGSWSLAINKDHATAISIYAFLIGYLMSRITMAWPQGCVSAYYVVFAENPKNLRFDTTIPDRIQELQQSSA